MRKIHMKYSTKIIIGILLITVGVLFGSLDYLNRKKINTFDKMNILLFETEIPENVSSDDEIKQDIGEDIDEPDDGDNGNDEQPTPSKPKERNYNYIGVLEIPKLDLKRGFLDTSSKYNKVNYNITVINGSTMPDVENNNLILAAHSGNCSVCFFEKLYKLSIGDEASVYYNGIKYNYEIVDIYEVKKTGQVAIYRDYNKNVLTLITCTRHSNTKQTVYILELQNTEEY